MSIESKYLLASLVVIYLPQKLNNSVLLLKAMLEVDNLHYILLTFSYTQTPGILCPQNLHLLSFMLFSKTAKCIRLITTLLHLGQCVLFAG